jgi:Fe-coproporphyrin III synthase
MLRRWLKFGKQIVEANLDRLRLPFKLTYVVTKECHSRCVNCKIWQVKPENELTLDEVRRFAKNSPFLTWLDLTGGEPTDRPDFVELVGAFLENCPNLLFLHFPTNGLRPDHIADTCRRILQLKPPKFIVTVSVDGPPKVNDALRGIKGDFTQAMATYRALRAIPGVEVYAGMTLFEKNAGLVDETLAAIKTEVPGFALRDFHVNVAHESAHYYGNEKQAPKPTDQVLKSINALIKQRGLPTTPFAWVEYLYQTRVNQYMESEVCPEDCAALYTSVFLSEKGVLYPCSIWDEPIGSIRDSGYSLVPLFQSARAKTLRDRLLEKDCPNCWTPCEAYPTLAANLIPLRGRRPLKRPEPSEPQSAARKRLRTV